MLTRHFGFGSLVVDGLTGQGVHSDLSNGHRGVLQLAVEPEDLGPFTGVLHHLEERKIDGTGLDHTGVRPFKSL